MNFLSPSVPIPKSASFCGTLVFRTSEISQRAQRTGTRAGLEQGAARRHPRARACIGRESFIDNPTTLVSARHAGHGGRLAHIQPLD
jgi:hypothetical protein